MKPRAPTGFGLILRFPVAGRSDYALGITSDTGYLSRGGAEGRPRAISEYYQDCDTVVLHLSTVEDLDEDRDLKKFISYSWPEGRNSGYPGVLYRKHLGFWGVVLCIRDLIASPGHVNRSIVLSEFGEEMLNNRVAILNELCGVLETLGKKGIEQAKRIFIGDVGTQVRLPEGKVGCNFGVNGCPRLADRFLEFDAGEGDVWMSHRGWNDRELVHFCEKHDRLVGCPGTLKPSAWGYRGRAVLDRELAKARKRTLGAVLPTVGNYWIRDSMI